MVELTSREVDGVATTEIHAILDDADLVKFAKLIPSADEAMALVHRVREIVLATWVEVLEPEPELEALSPTEALDSEPLDETPMRAPAQSEEPTRFSPEASAASATPPALPTPTEVEATEALRGEDS